MLKRLPGFVNLTAFLLAGALPAHMYRGYWPVTLSLQPLLILISPGLVRIPPDAPGMRLLSKVGSHRLLEFKEVVKDFVDLLVE